MRFSSGLFVSGIQLKFCFRFHKVIDFLFAFLLRHLPFFLRRRLIFFLLFFSPSSFLFVIIRFSFCLFFISYSFIHFLSFFLSLFSFCLSLFSSFSPENNESIFSACVDTTLVTVSHICVFGILLLFFRFLKRVSTDILDRKVFGTSEDIASEEKEIKNGKKYETKNSKN